MLAVPKMLKEECFFIEWKRQIQEKLFSGLNLLLELSGFYEY